MSAADPTMLLVESLKKESKKDWGLIIDNVPIFCAHEWWERTLPDGFKEARTIMPGDEKPDPKDGWKFCYAVTEDDLPNIAEVINKNFKKYGTPMKLLLGHTRPGRPQEEQPSLLGFSIDAKIGHYGPEKIRAVVAKTFYKKGCEDVPREFGFRSPEFKQSTGAITGIALLKTDPRLPMGVHAYEDTYFYGAGFMADKTDDKPATKPPEPAGAAETPDPKSSEPTVEGTKPAGAQNAVEAAPSAVGELHPLEPHESHFANRLMKHYEENHPAIKHLSAEYKKYADSQAAMAPASPTSGRNPATPVGAENGSASAGTKTEAPKKLEEDELMQDEEQARQYEERIAALESDRARMYAEGQVQTLRTKHRIKINDPKKLTERLIAARLKSEEACKEVLDDVINNYARETRAPVNPNFLPIHQDRQEEGPAGTKDDLDFSDPETAPMLTDAITRYAEANKIDLAEDDGWERAKEGFAKKKKEKEQRQTA